MEKEDITVLRLLGEIDRNGSSSQRELARRLNISLGLVNTFLKRLINKGYFKVTTMPKNRVKYFLTPEGLARKSVLTAEYLRDSVNFYKDVKRLLLDRYKAMEGQNVKAILFLGAGEVAELAYLYIQLTSITLAGVVDEKKTGRPFFGRRVSGMDRLVRLDWDRVLLTRLDRTQEDMQCLLEKGVHRDRIATL